MDKCVFVHTNERQWLGALVAEYSFRRNSANPDKFDVRFIHTSDYPYPGCARRAEFPARWHQPGLAYGRSAVLSRRCVFMPPRLMNWQGRAVVTDPDVFAVGDVI